MIKNIIWQLIIVIAVFFYGCDALEYHPYDGNIKGETGINEKNMRLIEEKCKDKEVIRFAFMTDTQKDYDDTERFVNALNARGDVDFVVHGGDITDLGGTKEFMWMRDIMGNLNVPYVALIGNHDCLANGFEIFDKIFGKTDFAFTAGNVRFICLNTNAEMFDYTSPIPNFGFIEEEHNALDPEMKTVVLMHAPPYSSQFNDNVARIFQRVIAELPHLQFCAHGHEHELSVTDIFEDGVLYYGCPNIKERQYFLFTILKDKYEYELINF
ncbi:MAG: metallophosphoesterase [Dysgonomonas sp.]|nr:metallophosphoesterase [Dysgonomonas sp.]